MLLWSGRRKIEPRPPGSADSSSANCHHSRIHTRRKTPAPAGLHPTARSLFLSGPGRVTFCLCAFGSIDLVCLTSLGTKSKQPAHSPSSWCGFARINNDKIKRNMIFFQKETRENCGTNFSEPFLFLWQIIRIITDQITCDRKVKVKAFSGKNNKNRKNYKMHSKWNKLQWIVERKGWDAVVYPRLFSKAVRMNVFG